MAAETLVGGPGDGDGQFISFTPVRRDDVLGNVGTFPVLRFPSGQRGCLKWRQRGDTGTVDREIAST